MDIVYRVIPGSPTVTFAERGSAEYVAHIWRALLQSKTWGELKRNLPDGDWEDQFLPWFEDREEDIPADGDLFTTDDAPDYYPPWLAQEQVDWFPEELIKKYDGDIGTSVHDGEFLSLPADKADEIAADLRALGHTVERTDLVYE
ncbi:hypothetical protein AWC02_08220 [Mycolicibacter engbaekii]|uniref:Uncharacterized protein n=1 Tax=Mycolicibacter engbaekii TaxID=188915 RepID=A0A1X1TT88_9MYCO|nr:hypothetical protein [Mycolicibacter engbaekii]ORV47817.1 hypothetical protein AWC02_08220 [Mycolicibacter engbaekii]